MKNSADWQMPEMDGLELGRRLTAMPLSRQPASLLVTPYPEAVKPGELAEAGYFEVLAKPLSPSHLFDALQNTPSGRHASASVLSAGEAESRLSRRGGGRILLAEDNPINQEVALALLAGAGLEVDLAEDGQDAVDKARTAAYDLILMDMQMPVLDGLGATRLIRALPEHVHTPILAMTPTPSTRTVLEYRGIRVEELCQHSSFLETSYLLLFGRLPNATELTQWVNDVTHHRRIKFRIVDLLKVMSEHGHPMDALQAAVAALGMFYPGRNVKDVANNYWSAVRLIAKLPTIVAAWARLRRGDEYIPPRDDLAFSDNFLYMLTENVPHPLWCEVFVDCLILDADPTMNASSFAGMVTASPLACYRVRCDAALVDLRPTAPFPALVDPVDYGLTHQVGARLHREGHPGLVTASARCNGGVYAVLNPAVLSDPRQMCFHHLHDYRHRYRGGARAGRRVDAAVNPGGVSRNLHFNSC